MGTVVTEFDRAARAHPQRLAVAPASGAGGLSFGALQQASWRIGARLSDRGVGSGCFAGIWMAKTPEHVAGALGILRAGAAFFSLSPKATVHQVVQAMETSKASVLLVDAAALRKVLAADVLVDRSRLVCLGGGEEEAGPPGQAFDCSTADGAPAVVLFTSGSTGAPQGVVISHTDLLRRVTTERAQFGICGEDRLLSVLPFSFDVGLNQLFVALTTGAPLWLSNSWLPRDLCNAVARERLTGISGVPSLWTQVLGLEPGAARAALGSLRYLTVSGGDLPVESLRRLRELAPGAQLIKTYGQSETFRSALLSSADFERRPGSVGRAVPGTQFWILAADGSVAPPKEPGEIVHRGDGVMSGYLGDAEGTRRKVRQHVLPGDLDPKGAPTVFTGDIGTMDEEGFLYVLGRADEMLKVHGHRFYPREVADVLQAHPEVQEVAVIGATREHADAIVYAEVILRPAAAQTEASLARFVAQRLPSYMVPAKISLVTDFPRTESGKIKRVLVASRYREER